MTKSTRRDVLSAIGIAAGACVLPSCLNTAKDTQIADDADLQTQWKYSKLDPNVTAQRAYAEFEKGHCMYAVFAAIVGQLADEHGEPYSQFPPAHDEIRCWRSQQMGLSMRNIKCFCRGYRSVRQRKS